MKNIIGVCLILVWFVFSIKLFRRNWQGRRLESVILFFVWITVAGSLIVALCAGQPAFNRLLQVVTFCAKDIAHISLKMNKISFVSNFKGCSRYFLKYNQ